MDKVIHDTQFAVATAGRRNALHWKNTTVTWDEIVGWVQNPATRKESGNYLLGTLRESTVTHRGSSELCTGIHRGKRYVESRSAVLLDLDAPEDGFFDRFTLLWEYAGIIHTTHSSTSSAPRYRLIIPLDREVTPEEYVEIAEVIVEELGRRNFDSTTTEPERFMFRPSSARPDEYRYEVLEGTPLDTEKYLEEFETDLSEVLPPSVPRNKRDPLEIPGTVGSFNTAYAGEWAALIDEYQLPYEDAGEGRWTYTGGTTVGGVVEMSDTLIFSHHSTDPAGGRAQNAFDLARIHLHSDLDEGTKAGTPVNRLPSTKEMEVTATTDRRVLREIVREDFPDNFDEDGEAIAPEEDSDDDDSESWKYKLDLNPKTGKPVDTIENWQLILDNDVAFRSMFYNVMTLSFETDTDYPWRSIEDDRGFHDVPDFSSALSRVERLYGLKVTDSRFRHMLNTFVGVRRRNPVREYLESLEWDGVPRMEESLPGVVPSEYTRLVARKALTSAVARMFEPGCKWDHMMIIYGDEGLGKTHWIEKMARGYSAPLGDIHDEDTLHIMHRNWIVTSDEGQVFENRQANQLKEFLTRSKDVFRMKYERSAIEHPRRSVVWGTTNDSIFLKRQEGNRRYLIVHAENQVDFDALTDEYIDQVWAEAVQFYKNGERMYLTPEESELAAAVRESFTEEDSMYGVIAAYLDRKVPSNWATMGLHDRKTYLMNGSAFGVDEAALQYQEIVCTRQLWFEALEGRFEPRKAQLARIFEILQDLPGWEYTGRTERVGVYGPQKSFRRLESDDLI